MVLGLVDPDESRRIDDSPRAKFSKGAVDGVGIGDVHLAPAQNDMIEPPFAAHLGEGAPQRPSCPGNHERARA